MTVKTHHVLFFLCSGNGILPAQASAQPVIALPPRSPETNGNSNLVKQSNVKSHNGNAVSHNHAAISNTDDAASCEATRPIAERSEGDGAPGETLKSTATSDDQDQKVLPTQHACPHGLLSFGKFPQRISTYNHLI